MTISDFPQGIYGEIPNNGTPKLCEQTNNFVNMRESATLGTVLDSR